MRKHDLKATMKSLLITKVTKTGFEDVQFVAVEGSEFQSSIARGKKLNLYAFEYEDITRNFEA